MAKRIRLSGPRLSRDELLAACKAQLEVYEAIEDLRMAKRVGERAVKRLEIALERAQGVPDLWALKAAAQHLMAPTAEAPDAR